MTVDVIITGVLLRSILLHISSHTAEDKAERGIGPQEVFGDKLH